MSYPGNHIVRISTGTVDIVPSGPTGVDLPVIARLPVGRGTWECTKRHAYQMAAAPGMAATLQALLDSLQAHPSIAYTQEFLDAQAALYASYPPGAQA